MAEISKVLVGNWATVRAYIFSKPRSLKTNIIIFRKILIEAHKSILI